jgi:formylmethanofuran dehydrogenase subunit E
LCARIDKEIGDSKMICAKCGKPATTDASFNGKPYCNSCWEMEEDVK